MQFHQLKKAFEKPMHETSYSGPLFHYTTVKVLVSILRSKKLWFTDYRQLNDTLEFKHGINIAQSIAREHLSQSASLINCISRDLI